MKKIPVDELLRLACIYAEETQREFASCNGEGTPEYAEAMEFVGQLHAYRVKRWGKTELEGILEKAVPTDVRKIACRENQEFEYKRKP
jgi:hypothetical protein